MKKTMVYVALAASSLLFAKPTICATLVPTVEPIREPEWFASVMIEPFSLPLIRKTVSGSGIPTEMMHVEAVASLRDRFSSAIAAVQVEHDPNQAIFSAWAGAFSTGDSSSWGSQGRAVLINMDFTVVPSLPGETIGDAVTMSIHFDSSSIGNGGPSGFIESARVLDSSTAARNVLVQFDELFAQTTPIEAELGDSFAVDLVINANAVKQGVVGEGINRADVHIVLSLDETPPPPPITMDPMVPEPGSRGLFVASLASLLACATIRCRAKICFKHAR